MPLPKKEKAAPETLASLVPKAEHDLHQQQHEARCATSAVHTQSKCRRFVCATLLGGILTAKRVCTDCGTACLTAVSRVCASPTVIITHVHAVTTHLPSPPTGLRRLAATETGGGGGWHRPSRSCTSKRTVAAGRCDMTSAAPPRLFDLTSQKTISPFVRRPKRSRLACWLAGWLAGWLLMKIWQNDRHGGTARPGSAAAASRAAPSIVVARIGLHVLGHQRASLSFFLAALGLMQPWLDPKVRPR